MADNKGVMIFTEVMDGKLTAVAKELLGAGRKLANDLKEELSARGGWQRRGEYSR
jgi:hypothetical protein